MSLEPIFFEGGSCQHPCTDLLEVLQAHCGFPWPHSRPRRIDEMLETTNGDPEMAALERTAAA